MCGNTLCQQLAIQHPIIKAPMAGGVDRPELVAAVSNSGGMGFIGGAYLTPDQLAADCKSISQLTDKPFGINLFVPEPLPALPDNIEPALNALKPFFEELQLPPPTLPAAPASSFEQQLAVALNSGARALSFTFGLLPDAAMAAARAKGILLVGTATSVEEAIALEKSGVDAVVAQGSEAGGHRGGFLPGNAQIGTLALIPQIVSAVQIPVIAAGGIMNGQGIRAALQLGASAAQLGTAFMTCPESGIPDAYKQAILNSSAEQTRLTTAFSGRHARGIVNRVMDQLDQTPEAILPFPYQNSLTRPMRTAAAQMGKADYLSLWAGQGLGLARELTANELMIMLIEEMSANR